MRIKDDLPTVHFTIGKITREFDSKLVMAAALAARDVRSVIARKAEAWYVGRNSGPLVFHGKEAVEEQYYAPSSRADTDGHILKDGSAIVYLHDEGGMFASNSWKEQVLGKYRVDGLRDRPIDRMCVWGTEQKRVISDYAREMDARIRVTGCPRFDLCTPGFSWMAQKEVEQLRNRFGPFILVCSRFSSVTAWKGLGHTFRHKFNRGLWPQSLKSHELRDLWFEKWRQDLHDLAEFVILVKELAAAWPDRKIVLRPHIREDQGFYRQAFARSKNVTVLHEGNVMSWIRAADLVVHSNCTTGIEAVLAGCPVLNFLPTDNDHPRLNVEVAGEAGAPAHSIREALEQAAKLLAGPQMPQTWSFRARQVLNNFAQDAIPLLVEETLSAIHEKGINGSRLELPPRRLGDKVVQVVTKCRGRNKQNPKNFDLKHSEMILEGCHANGIGSARIRAFAPSYIVVDPA